MIVGRSKSLVPPTLPVLSALLLIVAMVLAVVGESVLLFTARQALTNNQKVQAAITDYFAPGRSPTAAVVKELNLARRTVHVQAYSFTSAPIAQALVAAKRRGVDVEVILDQSNRTAQYSAADLVAHAGIPTFIDARHAIAHNKIMIIDGAVVLTGSFNFTKAAEKKNAENLLVIHDGAVAADYEENWQTHFAHSEPYAGR